MSEGIQHPNLGHFAHLDAAEFNHFIRNEKLQKKSFERKVVSFLVRQNWTSGIYRDEAAMLDALGKEKQ